MSTLSLSDTGLRLIKAFEGYRPVDRELVTGARVVGYGHRLYSDQPVAMTRAQASDTLELELRAYEELVNEEVHAPLSQSQFDALCSLAFNIGPKAFRESDTVRALNNGRVLDAANGFDIWRKAEIAGKTYVVDALMRRRTAEKSLFLRTERSLPASATLLSPIADEDAAAPTDDGLPVFSEDMASGVIARAPYVATTHPMRRRDDDPVGLLTLSEIIEPEDVVADAPAVAIADEVDAEAVELDSSEFATSADTHEADILDLELDLTDDEPTVPANETVARPIAEASGALGERLERLLDDADDAVDDTRDWPQSLIKPIGEAEDPPGGSVVEVPFDEAARMGSVVEFPGRERAEPALSPADDVVPDIIIDESRADDILRNSRPPAGPTREQARSRLQAVHHDDPAPDGGLWIPFVLGFALLGASVMALLKGAQELLGDWGPVLAIVGAIAGALMIVFALYLVARGSDGADSAAS